MNSSTTRPMEVDYGDPRIDSPEIKVVYPSLDHEVKMDQTKVNEPLTVDPNEVQVIEPNPQPITQHICTIDLQEAIKQHLFPILLGGLVMLILGYLIGKK